MAPVSFSASFQRSFKSTQSSLRNPHLLTKPLIPHSLTSIPFFLTHHLHNALLPRIFARFVTSLRFPSIDDICVIDLFPRLYSSCSAVSRLARHKFNSFYYLDFQKTGRRRSRRSRREHWNDSESKRWKAIKLPVISALNSHFSLLVVSFTLFRGPSESSRWVAPCLQNKPVRVQMVCDMGSVNFTGAEWLETAVTNLNTAYAHIHPYVSVILCLAGR